MDTLAPTWRCWILLIVILHSVSGADQCHCTSPGACDKYPEGTCSACEKFWSGPNCQIFNAAEGATRSTRRQPSGSDSGIPVAGTYSNSRCTDISDVTGTAAVWTVVLNNTFDISKLTIYHHKDHAASLHNFKVYIDLHPCKNVSTPYDPPNPFTIRCDQLVKGDSVSIVLPLSPTEINTLALCRVVIEVCGDFWFGEQCSSRCNCINTNEVCDKRNGSCISGQRSTTTTLRPSLDTSTTSTSSTAKTTTTTTKGDSTSDTSTTSTSSTARTTTKTTKGDSTSDTSTTSTSSTARTTTKTTKGDSTSDMSTTSTSSTARTTTTTTKGDSTSDTSTTSTSSTARTTTKTTKGDSTSAAGAGTTMTVAAVAVPGGGSQDRSQEPAVSLGAIAGVVCGVLLGFAVVVVAVVLLVLKLRKRKSVTAPSMEKSVNALPMTISMPPPSEYRERKPVAAPSMVNAPQMTMPTPSAMLPGRSQEINNENKYASLGSITNETQEPEHVYMGVSNTDDTTGPVYYSVEPQYAEINDPDYLQPVHGKNSNM